MHDRAEWPGEEMVLDPDDGWVTGTGLPPCSIPYLCAGEPRSVHSGAREPFDRDQPRNSMAATRVWDGASLAYA